MESAPAKVRYVIYTKVRRVFRHSEKNYASGIGDSAIFNEVDCGWHLVFEDSFEALHVGPDEPTLKVGDNVIITIEKANAQPRQTSEQ